MLLLLLVPADELAVVGLDESPLEAVAVNAVVDVDATSAAAVAAVEAAGVTEAPADAGGAAGVALTATAAISLAGGCGGCAGCSGCWNGRLVYIIMPSSKVSMVIIYKSQLAAIFSSI